MASPAKALADYVYIHKPDWKSIEDAHASLRIEPDILESISQEQLGRLCGNYSNHRVRKFLTSWKETLSK